MSEPRPPARDETLLGMVRSVLASNANISGLVADLSTRISRLEAESRQQNREIVREGDALGVLEQKLDRRFEETQAQIDNRADEQDRRIGVIEQAVKRIAARPVDPRVQLALIGLVGTVAAVAGNVLMAWFQVGRGP